VTEAVFACTAMLHIYYVEQLRKSTITLRQNAWAHFKLQEFVNFIVQFWRCTECPEQMYTHLRCSQLTHTERRGLVVNTPTSFSGVLVSILDTGDRLS
jgi:hypothetical protein